jgi:hypothetical protein
MVRMHSDIVLQILQTIDVTEGDLSLLNSFKAVSKAWLCAVRQVLREHASSRSMLQLFRHDCLYHVGGLKLPMHCRVSPYASTQGLTVLSTLDSFDILHRCVEAVLTDLEVEAERCCPYRTRPESAWNETWHEDECPCTWHFEEDLANAYDPCLCLAKLKIKSIRLELGGQVFTCVKDAMRTQFGEAEIENACWRGLCSEDSLLLACMHVGCVFQEAWLSVGMLRMLPKLMSDRSESVLSIVA